MRPVDADEVIDTINYYFENTQDAWRMHSATFVDGMKDGYARARSIVLKTPTADPVQWVLCSDRLPNSEEQVIVTCHDTGGDTPFDYTSCGWVTRNGEYWIVENEVNPYVVAWAPFPKPYKVKHE